MTDRLIKYRLFIDWSRTGDFIEETSHFLSANGEMRLATPESSISSPSGTEASCSLSLENADSRYSPFNESSDLYENIKFGYSYNAPMYLEVSIDGGGNYDRVMTGVIKIPQESAPYPGQGAAIDIDCRSRDEIIMDNRQSTLLSVFQSLHDTGATEAEIITQFLTDAGLDSGDYEIDSGLFVIPWAWLDDESPLQDIWTLAAACGGRFYCDPDGIFRYENMTHWLLSPHDSSQETIDKTGFSQFRGPVFNDRELFKSVTVIAAPRETLDSGSTLWESDTVVVVPANSVKTVIAKFRQPAYEIEAANYTAVTSGGIVITGDVSIVLVEYAQRAILTITNSNLLYAAELPILNITGTPVSGRPSIEVTKESSNDFWTGFASIRPGRIKSLRGNTYIQSEAQATGLAEFLRDRFELPRVSGKLQNVPGDPSRRLGDRITISDVDVMTNDRDAFITSINWRLSKKGFVQDIEWLDAGNEDEGTGLYPYDDYFVIGSNELGDGSDPLNAHIFY